MSSRGPGDVSGYGGRSYGKGAKIIYGVAGRHCEFSGAHIITYSAYRCSCDEASRMLKEQGSPVRLMMPDTFNQR